MSIPLFRFLIRNARRTVFAMLATGIASGLLSAAVLALIGRAVQRGDASSDILAIAFVAAVTGKIIATTASQIVTVRFAQDTILDMSLTLCKRILATPLRTLEQRGQAQILTTLTDDVSWVTWAVQTLPQLAVNLAVVAGCGAYLAWLSWPVFVGVVFVTALGALGYKLLNERAFNVINASRDARAALFERFTALSDGTKELMMHRARRGEFLRDEIATAAATYRHHNLAATKQHALADAWTQGLYYAMIGLLLFAFPVFAHMSPQTSTSYIIAMLYVMGPVWSIIQSLPTINRGQVALARIEALGGQLATPIDESALQCAPALHRPTIELNGVSFTYGNSESSDERTNAFTLGPLDFRLQPGELVFVVGGNGSGKSTFVKLLTGLYAPDSGSIKIADTAIDDAGRAWYREHFSVVFSEFHLFSTLHGLDSSDLTATAEHYLRLLEIDHKVSLRGRAFSTLALSQGQRKRLALVTAYLEDRPVYVFDEWAADQDPAYKALFYTKLLPDLRARGKAVVVITHDDRYFHLGDRVLKLEDGRPASGWNESSPDNILRRIAG